MNRAAIEIADAVRTAPQGKSLPPLPTASVIITNFNYGHYLGGCIESVLAQTMPAAQVIIVDDGSTDGSPAILEAFATRAIILRQPNRGQAAAINAGFAASTGAIVFLLDADDLLRPDAIETVTTLWATDLSALSFGLELVDGSGGSRGLYEASIDADDGDNRPRLLSGADFTFAPTSGHAFSRAFLANVLPMPEARWRISADAFLVRAAALHGRMKVLRRVLGAYRLHGGNNYQSENVPRPSMDRRGMKDLADALAEIAALRTLPASSDNERADLRIRMALTAARLSLENSEPADVRARWGNLLRLMFESGFVLPAIVVAATRIGGWRSATVRAWIDDPLTRPSIVDDLLDLFGWKRLERTLGVFDRPRWPETLRSDEDLDLRGRGPHRNIFADGWHRRPGAAAHWSTGREAALEFTLEPSPAPAWLRLGIDFGSAWRGRPVDFTVEQDGRRIFEGSVNGAATVEFQVARPADDAPVRLVLRCARFGRVPRPLYRRLAEPRPHFSITRLSVYRQYGRAVAPHLPIGARLPFAELLGRSPSKQGWRLEQDGTAWISDSEAGCTVSVAAASDPLELVLVPAAQSSGWLRIVADEKEVFSGRGLPAVPMKVLLPSVRPHSANAIALRFLSTPAEPGEDARIGFREIGITARRSFPLALTYREPEPSAYPRLNIGERVFTDNRLNGGVALLSGWGAPDRDGVRNIGHEAAFAFSVDSRATDLRLLIELRPEPEREDGRLVIGVSAGDSLLATAQLAGFGILDAPIPPQAVNTKGEVIIAIHAVLLPDAAEGAEPAKPEPGRFELYAVALSGKVSEAADLSVEIGPSTERPRIARLLETAAAITSGPATERQSPELRRTRRKLARLLFDIDARAFEGLMADASFLQTLDTLGARTAALDVSEDERFIIRDMRERARAQPSPDERLRIFLVSMLLLPACQAPFTPDLQALPAPLLYDSWRTAIYLGRDPALIEQGGKTGQFLGYVERLLESIEAVLAGEREGSPRYLLAVRAMQCLLPNKVMFGEHNLASFARLKGCVVERYLAGRGAQLALIGLPVRRGERLRVGVLVRDVVPSPEAWLLSGMYRELDQSRFELVLIRLAKDEKSLDPAAPFERELVLSGLTIEESVDAIRRLGLDIFVLGAAFNGYEKLMAIVAHRLAPLQVMTTAVAPLTTGLRSFDVALSSPSTEPADAPTHYSERLVMVPGPFQCFDFSGIETAVGDREQTRAEHLIPKDAVVMVSGAMMHKILPELMRAWTRILAGTTDTVLVLYPFARIWGMSYAAAKFSERFRTMLAEAGVDPERLMIIGEQPHAAIRRILSAADLYLDSFPFSGATTVVEAASSRLPVVALAGGTQRGLQGASWTRTLGMRDLVAHSVDDYVAKAVALASDPSQRAEIRARLDVLLRGNPPAFSDFPTFGLEFGHALGQLAEERGIRAAAPLRTPKSATSETAAPAPISESGGRLADPTSPHRYVFHHMPKAAGTTCREVFAKWFYMWPDYGEPWADDNPNKPHPIETFGPKDMLCGHFVTDSTRIWLRYPGIFEDERFRLITFVRDPLDMVVSDHFFRFLKRDKDPNFEPLTLRERLRREDDDMYAEHFAYTGETWRSVLDRYWFIGTVERLPECLAWLANYFGVELPPIPVLNTAAQLEKPDPIDVDIFNANHQLSYAIYREIDRRLDRMLRSAP